jgi:hypothetical protein
MLTEVMFGVEVEDEGKTTEEVTRGEGAGMCAEMAAPPGVANRRGDETGVAFADKGRDNMGEALGGDIDELLLLLTNGDAWWLWLGSGVKLGKDPVFWSMGILRGTAERTPPLPVICGLCPNGVGVYTCCCCCCCCGCCCCCCCCCGSWKGFGAGVCFGAGSAKGLVGEVGAVCWGGC